MATRSVPLPRARETTRPPYDAIVAVCAVLALPLWFVEIHTAFGLPAHPLLLHIPVIFVPLLGLGALAVAARPSLMERHGTALGAFAVVTMAATLLTAGAGQAFEDTVQGVPRHLLDEHAEAGETLRLFVIGLTALLVTWMLLRRRAPRPGTRIALQLLTAILAVGAIFFVLRAGHLGAELVWAHAH